MLVEKIIVTVFFSKCIFWHKTHTKLICGFHSLRYCPSDILSFRYTLDFLYHCITYFIFTPLQFAARAVLDSSSPQWNPGLCHSFGKLFQCNTRWWQLHTSHVTVTLNLGRMLLQLLLSSTEWTGWAAGGERFTHYCSILSRILLHWEMVPRFDSVAKKRSLYWDDQFSILFLPARFSDYF